MIWNHCWPILNDEQVCFDLILCWIATSCCEQEWLTHNPHTGLDYELDPFDRRISFLVECWRGILRLYWLSNIVAICERNTTSLGSEGSIHTIG